MSKVKGLVSAFNANIDAVVKVSGESIRKLIEEHHLDINNVIQGGERCIQSTEDAVRGLIHCFRNGIAEEWLIEDITVFNWLQENLGYDKLQMGGQGGIVANVMAVCDVNPVYVHCASLPAEQAGLFLDLENLQTTDSNGKFSQANKTVRADEIPLIHWIIEFDVNDKLLLGDLEIQCPKSNRFIATYDPLNFKLAIDPHFAKAVSDPENHLEYVILSGYQMLKEQLTDDTKGADRIEDSMHIIDTWKENHPGAILHLEMASTQDSVMRKHLLDTLAKKVDSLGFNERELIDLLEVMGEDELAKICLEETNSANLFRAMVKVQAFTGCPRLQLHMFGLYLTVQIKEFRITPLQNRNGMQLAATIAAAKAGTGAINTKDVLLWATGRTVSDVGLNELSALSRELSDSGITDKSGQIRRDDNLINTGLTEFNNLDVIAVPTILIDKPITLVGMGDTISSISLVAAN
ncbi:MAG: ADP-dependent glucokinase/phosphofructokinase [Bacteroidota bacterium]|nr:ADP-dependent glucokinase/phosphofructokinase [Bacteroidota bacterium]